LGVIIDSNLRWNIHIDNTVMRLRSVIFKFYKLNKILPMEVMRTVYEALYKSIMQYGLIIWGGCADKAIRPLIVQQKFLYCSKFTYYQIYIIRSMTMLK